MSLSDLWRVLAVALPALGALIANLPSVDLTYHLRAGDEILAAGAIPTTDTWTWTVAGSPWFDQQWLAQVILAATYKLAGWTGLAVLRAALVAVTFGLLGAAISRRNPGLGPRTVALLVIAAFAVAAVALALRPQLFGMALFALTLFLLESRRERPRAVWLIPVVAVLWANLHGSFVLLPAICGIAWIEDLHDRAPRRFELLRVGLISMAASALNPAGFGVWAYAMSLSSNPALSARVTEWQPPTLREPQGIVFCASVGVVIAVLARVRRRANWPALIWLFAFVIVGLMAVRGLAWWPLVAALVVGGLFEPDAPPAPRTFRPNRLNAVLVGAIALVMVMLLPVWRPLDPGLNAPAGVVGSAPAGITKVLADPMQTCQIERIWAPQAWGSWFEFAAPCNPIATDSRIELFPDWIWRTYDMIESGSAEGIDWLSNCGATVTVAAREQAALIRALESDVRWVLTYRDEDGAIFALKPGVEFEEGTVC
ncbi:MAG TPA: hypothetical protein VFC71_02975 [Candidatus Polarisedimenticolia bacterium]|nr:hypothetical protein [Candidatus Polarisedimenticolia bacterium]